MEKTMDKIVALAKSRGFVYPGSEIYGPGQFMGLRQLGVELKNNVKTCMVAEIYSGKPVQRRCRLCDSHELPDMGGIWTSGRLL